MIKEERKSEKEREREKKDRFEDVTTYQSAIGSLIYLSTATRPDISCSVNQAAQAMKEPTQQD